MNGWLRIDDPKNPAPTDGTPVLLWLPKPFDTSDSVGWLPFGKTHVVMGWNSNELGARRWECCFMEDGAADTEGYCSQFYMACEPTHWMPRPAGPEGEEP